MRENPTSSPAAPDVVLSDGVLAPANVPTPAVPAPVRRQLALLPSRTLAQSSAGWAALRIAAFFAVAAMLLVGADRTVNYGLRRIETSAFGVTNRVMSGRVNADIVISGSSRAYTHYDPRIIEEITGLSAFNIGRNGSQTDLQVAYLKAYLKHNAKPRLLIHNLDLFSFVTSREIFDPAQYMPYLDEAAIYDGVRRVYPHVWKWKYLPLYGYAVEDMRFTWALGLKGLVGLHPKEDHFNGYVPRYTRWTGDFEKFRADNPDGVRFDIEPQGVQDVHELVRICQEQGVPLLLVYSPEYWEMHELERNRGDVFAAFRDIGERFDVAIWDYSESPLSRHRLNFYNSQHLNAEGASAFSRDLAQRLLRDGVIAGGR